jgi:hypothetical protein
MDSYEHKVHRTTIKTPVFTIVDWASWDGTEMPALSTATQISADVREELNDALPDWANAKTA